MKFFQLILTGKDNKTYDIVRAGMLLAILIVCCESLYGVCAARQIDLEKLGEMMNSFAVSVANILGWGSIGCAAKSHTEPESEKAP